MARHGRRHQRERMSRTCEACAGQKSTQTGKDTQAGKSRIRRVLIGERIVALCAEHAAELQLSGAREIEELRALFPEQESRRSLISRRG